MTKVSILCVDDEKGVLESYLEVLTKKGDVLSSVIDTYEEKDTGSLNNEYNVLTADSGEKAVQIVEEELKRGNRFAAGFFDIRMPGGMDGYETIKLIREIDPEIYCAVVTAYTDRNPEQIRKLFSNGYNDHFLYFKKPFSALELEQTALFLTESWQKNNKEQFLIEELRQAKNDWEDVFNTIDEAITIQDLDYNILRSNTTAQHLLQLDQEEIVGAKCHSLFHGMKTPPENCPGCKTVRTGIASMEQIYEPYLKKHLEVKALPRFDHQQKLCGIVHIAKDISEKMKSEKALRRSEERFREMAELLPVAIFEMDINTNITFANMSAFKNFGYSQDDLDEGLKALELVTQKDRARAQRNLLSIARGIPGQLNEYEAVRKNGETFPINIHTALIKRNGEPRGFRGVVIDVSEKKRLETRLFQSQKIEAVGTLAGGVAHDFNNILTGIIGYTELLMLKSKKDDPLYGYMGEILKGGKRAANLINQILTFSRQDEVKLQPTRILPVIKEALKLLRATIPTTIEIRQTICPDCQDIHVMADPTQLHQVIMNLCTNAFHAMKETGGTLSIEIDKDFLDEVHDKVEQEILEPGHYLKLVVSDTGIGMNEEVKGRIFEPYFSTKKRGEGTGLGLAVTSSIIKRHKGDVSVESNPGEGTNFEIYLPILEIGAEYSDDYSEFSLPSGSGNILFIDDESSIVHMSLNVLESLGYSVKGYTDSNEAFEDFQQDPEKFDIVVTDMTMPVMDGVEISSRILELNPDMPIILCTGFSTNISEEQAHLLGIKKFLHKPVSLYDLATSIKSLLKE